MATLKDEHKQFIIDRLACFGTLSEIEKEFQDIFGQPVAKSTLLRYDPNTVQGSQELAQKWKDLFAVRRAAFIANIPDVPIANCAYRLKRLQKLIDEPKQSPLTVMTALRQAKEEVGGGVARGGTGGGADTPTAGTPDDDAEAAERAARIDALLDAARARRDGQTDSQRTAADDAAPEGAA